MIDDLTTAYMIGRAKANARVRELEQELYAAKCWQPRAEDLEAKHLALEQKLAEAQASAAAMQSLLEDVVSDYGSHFPGCSGDLGYPCSCGYTEWLKKVKGIIGG